MDGKATYEELTCEHLIRAGVLHVGLRDFNDDVLIGDVVLPSHRLELDVNS